MSETILELQQVSKWYPSDPDRRILDGADFAVSAGDRLSIVGSSGCGKSTLLNLVGTLDVPSEGRVIVGGLDTATLGEREIARLRSETVGFIFQLHHLLPHCTALENVLVPTLAQGRPSDPGACASRGRELLDRVGLADKADRRPGQLSGGERQRVAVVRALINGPKLLLADEPTGALDEENADRLVELLVELNESEGLALMVVTHDRAIAGRVGGIHTIRDGKVVLA
jgi:lipoprotein-releasing system ATP-binding protein